MSPRPLIGIAWPKDDYLAALAQAGAEIKILNPAVDPPDAVPDECDGLLLTGGVDVDPEHYGEAERHQTTRTDAARDRYEMALARRALASGMPILAICRGAQLLNVVAGGTLIQDIPSQLSDTLGHRLEQASPDDVHDVVLEPDTKLGQLMSRASDTSGRVRVNSRHHQSVKDVAPGFVVSAKAPDGVIEAIEKPGVDLCLAVQWHPENFWRTGEFSSLFEELVAASERRRQKSTKSEVRSTK